MSASSSVGASPSDDAFVHALVAALSADPQVVGLVLAGSSAHTERRDRWSDHDFLVVTEDGTPEGYRQDLSWLPHADDLAFWFRDTPHGLKALYRSGLLLEFAVFDRAEFAGCALNHYRVVIDRGGITESASQVHARSGAGPAGIDRRTAYLSFLSLLLIGTGRAHRGERLSANVFIRDFATAHVLRLATDLLDPADRAELDVLDPWRRVERAAPGLAADIDAALTLPITQVGARLIDVAEAFLAPRWDGYPADATALVRALLARA